MANNYYNDKKGRIEVDKVTIETVDVALYDYYDHVLGLTVEENGKPRKVPVVFATGERWKIVRDRKGLRDENGTLILPLVTIRRVNLDRTPGFGGLGQETKNIVISSKIHQKTGNLQNLLESRRKSGFPQKRKNKIVREYLTIPYPDFFTIFYEIGVWTQYQQQMNEILEKIFYKFNFRDSFVIPEKYKPGDGPMGTGYFFVGFRDGNIVPQTNVEEFSNEERMIRYTFNIKVPAYLMLDPATEPLSYGRDFGDKESTGKAVVYKEQNAVNISLSEEVGDLSDLPDLSEN